MTDEPDRPTDEDFAEAAADEERLMLLAMIAHLKPRAGDLNAEVRRLRRELAQRDEPTEPAND